jgi:hypothetical protein
MIDWNSQFFKAIIAFFLGLLFDCATIRADMKGP